MRRIDYRNPETGKTTGEFSNSISKSSNLARNSQISFKTQELTGNSVDFYASDYLQSTSYRFRADSEK